MRNDFADSRNKNKNVVHKLIRFQQDVILFLYNNWFHVFLSYSCFFAVFHSIHFSKCNILWSVQMLCYHLFQLYLRVKNTNVTLSFIVSISRTNVPIDARSTIKTTSITAKKRIFSRYRQRDLNHWRNRFFSFFISFWSVERKEREKTEGDVEKKKRSFNTDNTQFRSLLRLHTMLIKTNFDEFIGKEFLFPFMLNDDFRRRKHWANFVWKCALYLCQ